MFTSKKGRLRYQILSHELQSRIYHRSNDKQEKVHQQSWEPKETNSLELKFPIKKKNTSRCCISRKIDFSGVNKMWNKYTLIQCLILSSRHTSLINYATIKPMENSMLLPSVLNPQFWNNSMSSLCWITKIASNSQVCKHRGTHGGGRMQRNRSWRTFRTGSLLW